MLYCIIEFFLGIFVLIELFFGYKRLCLILNFLGFDLGIIFNGDEMKGENGGLENGLEIWLSDNFFLICVFIIFVWEVVDLWFDVICDCGVLVYFIENL